MYKLYNVTMKVTGLAVVVLLLCIALPASAQSTDEMYSRIANQVPEFGGMYYVGDVLHVNMTIQSPELQEAVITAIGNEFAVVRDDRPTIVFDSVKYGFNELRDWYAGSRDTIYSYPFITETDIDEKNNRIEIGVESAENILTLERALVAAGIPSDALSIIVRSHPVTESSTGKSVLPMMSLFALIGAGALVLVWRFVLR